MSPASLPDRVIANLQSALALPDLSGARYRIVREIGRGGMGIVYEVHDPVLDRSLALKAMDADLDEAKLIAQLEHPGIVPIHDAGRLPDGRVYYAMKLIRGQRMDEWMNENPTLAARLSVFLRACEPVAFAHARGVVHRDLKPGNIMIGGWGEVLVLDWGIAGTPGFMPPEQDSGPRGDVYSLGRVLEYLGGGFLPAPVRSIARKATANDPGERYENAAKLAADVERFLAGERVLAHAETSGERVRRIAAKHRVMIGLIAAYLLMRVTLIIFFQGR